MSVVSIDMRENTSMPSVQLQPSVQLHPSVQLQPSVQPSSKSSSDLEIQFDTIQQSLTQFKTTIADIQTQLRILEKTVKKESSGSSSSSSKKPKMRQPKITGFDVEEKIKPELAAFMQLSPEENTTSNVNKVTAYIIEYIRQHKLQDMADRKHIHLNDALAALFNITENPHLTYFNLHKYISTLFVRPNSI
jgi:chromatin remodeling complex protein RSC6